MTKQHPARALCERLEIELPVVQGGMTFGSDARLVIAVSNAGGLGTLGTFHYRTHEQIVAEVEAIRAGTSRPFAVNVPFFEQSEPLVERLALEAGVRCFTLGGWYSARVAELREQLGLTILVSVNAPTVARMVLDRPLDVLIVQGNESGGANGAFTTRQLFELLRPSTDAPILLAGGQWDGFDLRDALARGAAGIQLGTRFLFAAESPLHPTIKQQVLSHNLKRPLTTTLTAVKDTLNMRFVANKAYRQAEKAQTIPEIFQDKEQVFALSEAFFAAQEKPVLLYAGTGLYKLRAIQPCAEILAEVRRDYAASNAAELPAF
ncbi:MAG: nitronate monooxygenase [Planctomycetes bacterium]|nr:nitronate monooxygenase [Planctomycetota bacterium]